MAAFVCCLLKSLEHNMVSQCAAYGLVFCVCVSASCGCE